MNLRTLTCFLDPGQPPQAEILAQAGQILAQCRTALEAAGYTIQTTRLACPPLFHLLQGDAAQAVPVAQALEGLAQAQGFNYVALGPVWPGDPIEFFAAIPQVLAATRTVFASACLADAEGLSFTAAQNIANIIQQCSTISPDGFGNLRFAALAQVPPGSPFFPAAYHESGPPTLGIGVEAAELAVRVCAQATTLAEARTSLIESIEEHARRMQQALEPFTQSLPLLGFDFTFAPFPEATRSLGTALERLLGGQVGEPGMLAASAFLTDTLDRAHYPRTGFNGLFFPVFEDAVLALRAAEGLLDVNDLLLYSTVCGAGLDTVPLAGDITQATLAAILADVGALALRLNKPLTARLMPLPNKRAGDLAVFDFAYFAPSRVLSARGTGLGGLLTTADKIALASRSPKA